MIGPENCNRFAIVANIPARTNIGPRYFLNEAIIFFGVESLKLA
jgi:hypothetical protein